MLVGILQGLDHAVMLGIQVIQQLIAEDGEAVFLAHLVLFLPVGQGSLADQQDDQQHEAGQEQVEFNTHISRRPSNALSSVTSSVYSRSPPTGTPWAIRVQRMFMGLSSRAI